MRRATPFCRGRSPRRWRGARGAGRCIGSTARRPGQTQKEAFVNEALARLDALAQPAVQGEAAAPPAAPASGESYIVGPAATGAWVGREGQIATWAETQWLFAAPVQGARVHDAASGSLAVYAADGWRRAASPDLPTGGAVIDNEARAAIAELVARLHRLGIFSA